MRSLININSRTLGIYLPIAIALTTLAVFSPVLWHDFVGLDDPVIVYANPLIQSGVTLDAVLRAFTSSYESTWIPLTWISHMLDVQVFGMNPAGHHFVSLLLHSMSCVLLFLFLNRATNAPLKSAAVALLFALHPLHVQSVAWAAERKDVLSAFFWMLTLYGYAIYSEKPGKVRYLLVLCSFSLGLLSKPMVVTLPVVLLLLDWWPLGRLASGSAGSHASPRSSPMKLLGEKVPFFALSAGVSVVTYMTQQATGGIVAGSAFGERAARACISYVAYICKMIWPGKLAVFYPLANSSPSLVLICFSIAGLLLMTMLAVRLKNKYPFLITGWFWYVVVLLPVIGLVQVGGHFIADHYTYLSLIGLFIMMAWGLPQFMEGRRSRRKALGIVSAIGLAAMITLTSLQLRHWQNTFTLLTHAVEVTENNWLALNNLGIAYLNKGQVDEAIRLFKESLTAKPAYVLAMVNLGTAYSMKKEFESAVDMFNQALQYESGKEKAHLSLGLLYLQVGEHDLALREYHDLQGMGSPYASYLINEMASVAAVTVAR